MAFNKTTYQQTVQKIDQSGPDGFWYAGRDITDTILYKVGYLETGTVESVSPIYGFDTFRDLLVAMIVNNIELPSVDVAINAEKVADKYSLNLQFEDPAITNADLQTLANTYDVEAFCKFVGVFAMTRRFYLIGLLSLQGLSNVFIYLGQKRRITRQKVETSTNWLLSNGQINQSQYDSFWIDWADQVGL